MPTTNKGARAALLTALASLLLVGAGCFGSATTEVNTGNPPPTQPPAAPAPSPSGIEVDVNASATLGEVREIKITAKQFTFEPATVTVKKGERVRLVVDSTDTTHGIAIPAFNVNVTAEAGKPASAEFVADKEGTYPFFCSVFCGSGHSSMKGSLIVE